MNRYLIVIFLGLFCHSVMATDLGQSGHSAAIGEQDFRAFIGGRLAALKVSGKIAQFQNDAKARIARHIAHPANLGLSRAGKTNRYYLDPTLTLSKTIPLPHGGAVAYAGQKINPFDKVTIPQTLVFFDASDPLQVGWVKMHRDHIIQPKWILTGGDIRDMNALLGHVYFDQRRRLTGHFSIHHVPALVRQSGKRWQVTEVAVAPWAVHHG